MEVYLYLVFYKYIYSVVALDITNLYYNKYNSYRL